MLLQRIFLTVMLIIITPAILANEQAKIANSKTVVGLHEIIAIFPENMELIAKMDTGATRSSIDAQNIEFFRRDDQEWVRFEVNRANQKRIFIIERPLIGSVQIKSRAHEKGNKEPHLRPVVLMQLCFGDTIHEVEVNLTDRSHFKYPFLLGAKDLTEFNKIVDPAVSHLTSLRCSLPSAAQEHKS